MVTAVVAWWFGGQGITQGLSGLLGALLGGTIAAHAPGYLLQRLFGIVVLTGALRVLPSAWILPGQCKSTKEESMLKNVLLGFAVGVISGLTGIGGGVILVPAMCMAMNFGIHQAVGTSSIAIAIISIGGILSYGVNGLGIDGLPPYSLGYINLFQWAMLAVSSVFMAQVGVRFSHRLPAKQLTYIFTTLMIYIGLKMIGALELFHLNI